MKDRVLNRMEELSRTIGDLIDKREQTINDLRRIESEIDSLSVVVFELKSLLDSEEPKLD
jgi:hypothetical protein